MGKDTGKKKEFHFPQVHWVSHDRMWQFTEFQVIPHIHIPWAKIITEDTL